MPCPSRLRLGHLLACVGKKPIGSGTVQPDMIANDFFSSIESFSDFKDVFDADRYRPLPSDWLVVVCDIQGSTEAIKGGKYKEVNIVGASAIIAVLNALTRVEIPYV